MSLAFLTPFLFAFILLTEENFRFGPWGTEILVLKKELNNNLTIIQQLGGLINFPKLFIAKPETI